MIRRICSLLLLLMLSTSFSLADNSSATDYLDLSKLEQAKQFQFLVGNWTYATADNSAHGKSTGLLQVNESVIAETTYGNFAGTAFIGQALYLYDEKNQQWLQHWIDSLGTVLESTVKMADYEESELPAMVGELEFQGQKLRHVWYNISENAYQTDLLVSADNGETYQLIRRMPYQKAVGAERQAR